jgi:hypothetical protein
MMEQHPVEDSLLGMTRMVEPGHIVNEESRNAPGTGSRADSRDSAKKSQEMRSEKRQKP